MATVRLLKDRDGKKAGAIVSMPFLAARDAIAAKEVERVVDGPRPEAVPDDREKFAARVAEKAKGDVARLTQENAKLRTDNTALEAKVAELTKLLDSATSAKK